LERPAGDVELDAADLTLLDGVTQLSDPLRAVS
jgi:hypothetical protein